MRRRRFSGGERALRRSAALSAVCIVIASVMSFGFVEYAANVWFGKNPSYHPVDMVGMIGPMGFLIGLITYASFKATNRYTSKLLAAIDRVAGGDFGARLDESDSGHYREVFANFNAMCEELQGVQTLRDDFINHFSHEFKTPITSINGFARLLLEEEVSPEERASYLGIIASESERLAGMSTSALLMTRLDSLQRIADAAPYSLDEQIRNCAILLSPQWGKKRIDLSAELEEAVFVGNEELMRHVWINVIGNAVKFTPEGGKISFVLAKADREIEVRVADSGRGMAEEELEHAFDKYYQGDQARSAKGLGLGLSIAKRIVELSGGRIETASVLGEGSVITVRLPLRS